MPDVGGPSARQHCSMNALHRRTTTFAVVFFAAALLGSPSAMAAKKVVKPRLPAAGGVCSPVGARASGTALTCVRVGAKLQWQPKGSKLNPYQLGENFEWTQSTNGTNPGALISVRRLAVIEYLPDASGWVSAHTSNQEEDIFAKANGRTVRGVKVIYTLVSATDASSRALGSLSTFWLGDDRDAGCCTDGVINWTGTPDDAVDAYLSLDDGATRTGIMVFARADEQLGAKPLLRLAWDDVRTTRQSYVYFALTA